MVFPVFFQNRLERQPRSQNYTSDCNTQYENQFELVIIAILKAFAFKHEHKIIWQWLKSLMLQVLHSEA